MSKGSLAPCGEQEENQRLPVPARPFPCPHPSSAGAIAQCSLQKIKTHFITIILGWSGRATLGFLDYQKKNISFLGIAII